MSMINLIGSVPALPTPVMEEDGRDRSGQGAML